MSSEPTQEEESLYLEELDHDRDIVIVIGSRPLATLRRFLVSSKILSLASPVFKKLFSSHFLEGALVATQTRPEIPLHEDDPTVMGIIFSFLHYQEPDIEVEVDAKMFANIAVHCDKYDCVVAIRPWITVWFGKTQWNEANPTEELGFLLTASHLMRSSVYFSKFSQKAQVHLTMGFASKWDEYAVMDMLPRAIKGELYGYRNAVTLLI